MKQAIFGLINKKFSVLDFQYTFLYIKDTYKCRAVNSYGILKILTHPSVTRSKKKTLLKTKITKIQHLEPFFWA
jgi:hypothetical protein